MTQIRLSFTSKKNPLGNIFIWFATPPQRTFFHPLVGVAVAQGELAQYQAAGYNVVAKWCLQNTKRHGTNQCHYLPVVSLQWKKYS